ncbi:SRPBCC family protein [Salinactinospora qingdaonensis]|uniref:SRPBCC family protein n=2 Tax=Salinactinospora qingdaonensis TaxID=702744 RepID=A0ABP7EX49_9ACTN
MQHLLLASAEIFVPATAEETYSVVSDLPRSGEWSPECVGGEWVLGEPAAVGSVFRGENVRKEDVVSWAPVVRGRWHTESEVIVADPGRSFHWAMRTNSGEKQDSVWAFELEPAQGGCVLTHHFRMGRATEGILNITAEMDEAQKQRFFREWNVKIEQDLESTLHRIRDVIVNDRTARPQLP